MRSQSPSQGGKSNPISQFGPREHNEMARTAPLSSLPLPYPDPAAHQNNHQETDSIIEMLSLDETPHRPKTGAAQTPQEPLPLAATTTHLLSVSRAKHIWTTYIQLKVPLSTCRDHLALERVFLSYIRTSLAFAMFGITSAQLFRLSGSLDVSETSVFYRVGKPVGVVSEVIAIGIVCMGSVKWMMQQQRMVVDGRVRSGGWEMVGLAGVVGALFVVVLVLLAGDTASGRPD